MIIMGHDNIIRVDAGASGQENTKERYFLLT